jgi:hypothetical protein
MYRMVINSSNMILDIGSLYLLSKSHKSWTWTHSRSLLFHDGYTICKWFIANIGVNTDMYNHIGGYEYISKQAEHKLPGSWGLT